MDYFSKNMRFLRSKKGLRQNDLANVLGMSRATINNYESGRSKPDFQTLEALVSYFGVSSTEFLDVDLETVKKSEILSKELGSDLFVKNRNNSETINTKEEDEFLKWAKAISLFSTNVEAFELYNKGYTLSYSLFEAEKQVKEVFQKRMDLIAERYGEKNPGGKDNTQFFAENAKELKKIEDFLMLYTATLNELTEAVEKARVKFKIQ